jgi:molecular chaperone DnaK
MGGIMGRTIGIDLGTTFSAVAIVNEQGLPEIVPNREGERITPSVVLFDGHLPIVGTIAKQSASAQPLNVVQFVKRQMGNPSWKFRTETGEVYTPEEISAIILKRLKDDAEAALGEVVTDAVVTVPAYFDDAQRKATQDAGRIAGLNIIRIVNEPTAAAIAYVFSDFRKNAATDKANAVQVVQNPLNLLVYDLGGGTFDVTVMRFDPHGVDVLATGGDKNLGGFDWDNEIMKFLNDEFKNSGGVDLLDDPELEQDLRNKAEVAKKTLSGRDKATVLLSAHGKNATIALTRDTFEKITAPLLKRTGSIMQFTLEDAGLEWNQIDKILLTGGSTRMKAVPEWIEKVTGKHPSNELHPDEVVALGAALQGAIIRAEQGTKTRNLPALRVQDINTHSLGVVAINSEGKDANSIVLKRGTPTPCKVTDIFHTVVDNQTMLHVQVTEGEGTELAYIKIVGEGKMPIPPYPKESPVEVHFEYDADGIIHCRVFDLVGKKMLGELNIKRVSNRSDQEVDEMKAKLRQREVG